MKVEVETQEAQLRVLSDLVVRVAIDGIVRGVVERELPVDVTARESPSGLAGGGERPERHAFDGGCAQEVVLVRDELETKPRIVRGERERPRPDRAFLEVEVRVRGRQRIDRPAGERRVDGSDASPEVGDIAIDVQLSVGRMEGLAGKLHAGPA